MSNIFPLCPCPDEEDPRIQCFKKSIKNKKKKCDKNLFPYYKNIIKNIREIFENSINAIERIENIKLEKTTKDYVTESIPMFQEFENAIEKYIEYRDKIKIEEKYLNVQECFYVNCNKEIKDQMKQYTQFIQLFKNFISQRKKNKKNTELEIQHDKLIDKVIKTIIALYADEVEEYQRRFIAVSPKRKNKKQNFDEDEDGDEEKRQGEEDDGIDNYDEDENEDGEGGDEEEDGIDNYDEGNDEGKDEEGNKKKDEGGEDDIDHYDEGGDKDGDEDKDKEEGDIDHYNEGEDKDGDEEKGQGEEDDIGHYDEGGDEDNDEKTQKYGCKSNSDCQLLKNCLSQRDKIDNPCECVNSNSDNIQSKKKACKILGPCKYSKEECTKRGVKIDFSYNNFCEGIEELDGKISEKTRCSRNKKLQKKISSIFKYKDTKETCSNIINIPIKDCIQILEDGKKCCISYFKKREKFFNKSKEKNKNWNKIKTSVKSSSNFKKSGNELREKDKKDREKKTQKAGYKKKRTKKLKIWK